MLTALNSLCLLPRPLLLYASDCSWITSLLGWIRPPALPLAAGPGLRVIGAATDTMGPWGEPELLVWRPEAVASEPPVPVGLEVKLGALVLLLVLTLLCSLVPICVLRRPGANYDPESSAARQKFLSLVSCFAGGVFLATCLLDLLPDYLAAIDEALAALHVTLQFPLQEFILAMGFFLVLVMEQITLAYKEQSGPPRREETRALLGTVNSGPQHWHDGLGVPHARGASAAPSALRACVLVFSLALHSVFKVPNKSPFSQSTERWQ